MQHVEFKFAKAWRHAGVDYKEGDVAKLSPAKAEKLAALGAGARADRPGASSGKVGAFNEPLSASKT